jgi:ribonuclease-3
MSDAADERLQALVGHQFSDPGLLGRALTHRSAGSGNNERLEFLGDAILSLVIAESLYSRDTTAPEGRLTRLRASLVRRETLAAMARDLELGPALRLGSGELKSGGRDRDSILADALEAILGALYVDAGFETCRDTVRRLFASRLERALAGESVKDPKTLLQETLQAQGLPLPTYRVVDVDGAAHSHRFTVECALPEAEVVTVGVGRSRRRAEQVAASHALERIAAARGDRR